MHVVYWVLIVFSQGVANYYSVQLSTGETFENIIWWYRVPLPECADIKGYVAFYDETVDTYFDDVFETAEGATVYRVNAVGAIDTSVITSTLCKSVLSSVP